MDKQINKTPLVRFPEFKDEWQNEQLGKHIKKTDKKNKGNLNLPVYSINNKEGFLPQSEQFDGVNSSERGYDISIYKIIQPKTFAYNPARINVGSIGYSHDLENILISSLYVCFQTDDKIEDSFLLQFLGTDIFKTSVLRYQEGGVRQYLFFDSISKITFSIPNLKEQKKIAHFFTILDKKLNQLQQKKSSLEAYKKGMMQKIFAVGEKSMVNGKLLIDNATNHSPLTTNNYIRFKDENGKTFPDWEVKKFANIFDFHSTNSLSRDKLNYSDNGIRNIHYGDIHTKFSSLFNLKNEPVPTINKDINLSKVKDESYCKIGDLVIADASEDYLDIGKTIELICLNNERVIAGLHTILARPKKNLTALGFSSYLMQSTKVRKQIMIIAQGTKVLGLSSKQLSKIEISLPTLKEQTHIANFLTKIDNKINAVNAQIETTKTYKKGLLQQMFV